MYEKILIQSLEDAYTQLEEKLVKSKCRIIAEEAPRKISVIQGSIWGTTPKTAKKKTTFALQEDSSGTKISTKSILTSDYIALTVVGIVFSLVLMGICLWISLDLQNYASTGTAGFWGWLAQTQGFLDINKAALFARLCWFLTAFLAATLIVESIIVIRVKVKIDAFAEETLKPRAQQK